MNSGCEDRVVKLIVAISFAILLTTPFPNLLMADGKHPCELSKNVKFRPYKLDEGKTLPSAINKRFSTKTGSIKRGLKAFVDPGAGNCLACHSVSSLLEKVKPEKFETVQRYGYQGNIGGSLDGIGKKFTTGELRLIIAEPRLAFPTKDIAMPSYYKPEGLKDTLDICVGKTVLSAQQVEDIVKYLGRLK